VKVEDKRQLIASSQPVLLHLGEDVFKLWSSVIIVVGWRYGSSGKVPA
jgi:hypothetical protein